MHGHAGNLVLMELCIAMNSRVYAELQGAGLEMEDEEGRYSFEPSRWIGGVLNKTGIPCHCGLV